MQKRINGHDPLVVAIKLNLTEVSIGHQIVHENSRINMWKMFIIAYYFRVQHNRTEITYWKTRTDNRYLDIRKKQKQENG